MDKLQITAHGAQNVKKGESSTPDQREEWFMYWMDNGRSDLPTAEHFGIQRMTIAKWRKKETWEARALKLDQDMRNRMDKKITAERMSNIDVARRLKKGIIRKIFGQDENGVEKILAQPTIRDLLMVCQYEDELAGNMPKDESNHIVQLFTGVNGSETAAAFNDRNLGAIFGDSNGHSGNGHGTEVKVPSPASRISTDN